MIPIPSVAGLSTGRIVLTVLLALIPTIVGWWIDRRILTKIDDPALPELLDSRRRTTAGALAISVAVMIVLAGAEAAWGIPLLVVLLIASAYPVRTRVLGETWGFGSYLWHTTLSIIGGFGFWIALGYTPTIVQAMLRAYGANRWWLAIGVAVVLMAWEEWYPRFWLWAHAAKAFDRTTLVERFETIVQRAGTVVPAVYSVGPKGSRFVNAVALPSVRRPSIAMGNALLDLLDDDENAAIFAHEMAHFDHLNPRWVRRSQLVNRLLISAGVTLPIIATFYAPRFAPWIGWLWPVAILVALVARVSKSQQHETESDLRAAALCGDPEALVRALAKLHFHARIPRRWSVDVERVASHPSLVRRIQAIRAGGAAAAEQLGAATLIRSPRAGSWVVFDASRAYWLDGVAPDTAAELAALRDAASSYRATNYQDLAELRVSAAGNDRTLHARTRAGDAWSVPIAADDVARVQQTLDIVDVRLGRASAATSPGTSKFLGIMAVTVAIVAGQAGILLVPAALALWKPGPAALAALGAMSLVRAVFGALEGNNWFAFMPEAVWLAAVALVVVGVFSIITAVRQVRAGATPTHRRVTLAVLGGAAVLAAIGAASAVWQSGSPSVTLLEGVPLFGTAGTALFGLAAALLTGGTRTSRRTGLGTLVAATTIAFFGIDPSSFTRRNALAETTAQVTADGESDLGSVASGLRVSPSGDRFLVQRFPIGRRPPVDGTQTFSVGRVGGPVHDVAGIAGDFVDDDRILVVGSTESGLEVRIERADTLMPPLWADTLAGVELDAPRLVIDRDASSWSVVGTVVDNDTTVVLSGRIGEKGTPRRFAVPDSLTIMGDPLVFGTTNTLVAPVFASSMRGASSLSVFALAFSGGHALRTELWRVRGGDVARIGAVRGMPQCGSPLAGSAACVVRQMNAVALYAVTEAGALTEVARLSQTDLGAAGVGPGLRASSMTFRGEMLLADLASRRLTRVRLPSDSAAYITELRSGSGYVVTLGHSDNRRSVIRRYRVPK